MQVMNGKSVCVVVFTASTEIKFFLKNHSFLILSKVIEYI